MEREGGRWRERERNSVEFPYTRNDVPFRRQRSPNETLSAGYGILPPPVVGQKIWEIPPHNTVWIKVLCLL